MIKENQIPENLVAGRNPVMELLRSDRDTDKILMLKDAGGSTLGTVKAVLSHRTSEETKEDDLYRATETVTALIPQRYVPQGGICRGMWLVSGGARYRTLVPVDLGRFWRLKCERVYVETEAPYEYA